MKKAVFLDKDGTLVRNVAYNFDPGKIELMEGVEDGLVLLKQAGYGLFIVSNQSGIARGYGTEKELGAVWEKIAALLAPRSVAFDGFYYCPHYPDAQIPDYTKNCNCRKPQPGMLLQAISQYRINPEESWMIGDILDDVEAGNRAGVRSVLVDSGSETEWFLSGIRNPYSITKTFLEAAMIITGVNSFPIQP